jgi:hypothetical protein
LPSNSPKPPDENVLEAPVRSWWLGLVAGRTGEPHPISPDVRGVIEEGKVTLTGTVENDAELSALRDELKEFQNELFETVDDQVTVKPDDSDVSGILSQTIVALFKERPPAQFAVEFLREHAGIQTSAVQVFEAAEIAAGESELLPVTQQEELVSLGGEGCCFLFATVDEPEAFRVRQLLDEDCGSTATLVLPPTATRGNARTAK